jgi:hypothetical protein
MSTVDEIELTNAREQLDADRRLRQLRLEEQEALTRKAQTEALLQELVLEMSKEERKRRHGVPVDEAGAGT